MNTKTSGFPYGKCPCCDKIIPVPSGTTNTFCCFCGSKFLSAAAMRLYGQNESTVLLNAKTVGKTTLGKELTPQIEQPGDPSAPKMMTVRELAKATGIAEYALRRLLKQGKLPAFYVGSKALINYNKVLEILDSLA